jgi:DNA-binding response OmpR family regulator
MTGMVTNCTLLCIHRDPSQLILLEQNGYELVTAASGCDGLRLFMSRPVDAIVVDYRLGLLDGGVVATEIKKVKPQVPIVMLTEEVKLPDEALKSVDALVAKSDGPHFLLAAVHFVLNVRPAQRYKAKARSQTPMSLRRPRRSRQGTEPRQPNFAQSATGWEDAPFSPAVWRSIRNGTVRF